MFEWAFLPVGKSILAPPFLCIAASLFVMVRFRESRVALVWLGRFSTGVSLLLLALTVLLMAALYTHQLGEVGDRILSAKGWSHPFSIGVPETSFTLDIHIDALSLYFVLLANLIACAASWSAAGLSAQGLPGSGAAGDTEQDYRLDRWLGHPAFLHACLNGFHVTMLLVPILDNLIGLWIAIELTTLFSALLVGYSGSKRAWEAAWKYLIITSAGIVLALLGTMFLTHAIDPDTAQAVLGGSTAIVPGTAPDRLMNWTALIELAEKEKLDQKFVILSFLFVLIGYGTKAGLAPMHTWLPDGHGEAPAPVSALLSGVLLKLALYAILRFYTITNVALKSDDFTSNLLLGAGLLSLLVATPLILKRNHFKRVLAYHSVEHMGIICVGIGVGTPFALTGALLHTLNHAVTKTLMFLAYGNVERQYKDARIDKQSELKDSDITGLLLSMPKTATLLTLGGLALVGTPPFGIFISELMILWGAMEKIIPWRGGGSSWIMVLTVAVFMLTTTLIFFGLIRHLSDHLFGRPDRGKIAKESLSEAWGRDLLPLLVLAAFVVVGVFAIPWGQVLAPCVSVLSIAFPR